MSISDIIYLGSPIEKASNALILLHGRGGTAQGMLSLAEQLGNEEFHIVVPQASDNSWYPRSFMDKVESNEPILSSSILDIKNLIEKIAQYLPKPRIFVGGFSQGACLSLEIAARFPTKYGGIMAFTGGLIGPVIDENIYTGNLEQTNVFMSNGDHDPYIPLFRSEESKMIMEKLNAHVIMNIYDGKPHIVSEEEIIFVKKNILLT